jgi:hypothetical protein
VGRYQPKRKLYQLRFEDYPGFEVTMRGLSIDGFMGLARQAAGMQGLDVTALKGPELEAAMDKIDGLFTRFAKSLRAWNLDDDDGVPVPETVDGVRTQDLDFILEIVMAWMDAIASVDIPLPQPANGSGTFPEGSLPMEPLSLSLPS